MLKSKSNQKQKKSRQEINEESRELKRKRKRKGLPSGSRFSDTNQNKNPKGQQTAVDPRIGSKKPIALTIDTKDKLAKSSNVKIESSSKPVEENISKAQIEQALQAAEKELQQLENDPQLDKLLDMTEQHKKLNDEQAAYLASKLGRIDELMRQLGYTDDDFDEYSDDQFDEEAEKREDIVELLKRK